MSDTPRIEALRRRVEKDPTSIAFAQLAEEYRRSGDFEQAVKVCREGLARHPGYLSAQVTLGRALMELEQFDEAARELESVLQVAPDNLAAIRALADIHQRRPEVHEPIDVRVKVEPPEPAAEPEVAQELAVPPDMPPVELEMAPLEEASPVDLSLDASMPSFDEMMNEPPPAPVSAPEPDGFSFETPAALTEDDLPSLEALDSLSLDLPPLPDFSNFTLDTEAALDLPEPTFTEPPLDTLEATPTFAEAAAGAQDSAGADNEALQELEQWLAAIVADRSQSR